jgi:predicted acylesterase/phospholipase RssA
MILPTAPRGFRIEISGSIRVSALIDPTDLFRIIFNLFHNAVGIAQEKGTLSVLRVHVSDVAQRTVIDISDNGPGLPARVKTQLFRPRPRRFGLKLRGFGLAIARELAERNGGSVASFFTLNPLAQLGASYPLGAGRAGYYSTAPLRATLLDLVDFSLVNRCSPRLTVGAAHLQTSAMRYFDSRDAELGVEHIMASGALPPAFPPVRIDGELYWDGGILSNTPTEAVFDDNPRKNSVIFAVHMWNPTGPEPETMADVFNRQKDIQYSSRIATHIARQQQTRGLRHVISELLAQLPEHERRKESIKELAAYGCPTRMHVVRLLAPMLERENHTKDIDFSASGINSAGKQATPIRNRCFSNARGRASSTHSKGSSCMLAMSLCLSRQSRSPVTLLPAREAWIARGSLPNSSLPAPEGHGCGTQLSGSAI